MHVATLDGMARNFSSKVGVGKIFSDNEKDAFVAQYTAAGGQAGTGIDIYEFVRRVFLGRPIPRVQAAPPPAPAPVPVPVTTPLPPPPVPPKTSDLLPGSAPLVSAPAPAKTPAPTPEPATKIYTPPPQPDVAPPSYPPLQIDVPLPQQDLTQPETTESNMTPLFILGGFALVGMALIFRPKKAR